MAVQASKPQILIGKALETRQSLLYGHLPSFHILQ
jgi:hypothetical protein